MTVREDSYKGHPMLVFDDGGRYPVQLGLRKIQAVLDNLDEARAFVERHLGPDRREEGEADD